ncbi:hypothetical protein QO010_001213 [Caulobacter ginsengisoli]|uniref:Uncharacterized protein n=1 Tax=Caulobacter ginsengisoli TaxID=400775 RepID=A0ABU0IR62_9CAUL|nr:hypothetical protein [Caulobacter ginsengisoli]MDQ0463442.1 hypothetical protein [Caulobacter ginsengisoli]
MAGRIEEAGFYTTAEAPQNPLGRPDDSIPQRQVKWTMAPCFQAHFLSRIEEVTPRGTSGGASGQHKGEKP